MQLLYIARILGIMLLGEAVLMLPSLAVSLIYGGGDAAAFLLSMGALVIAGLPPVLLIRQPRRQLFPREGFALVALSYILLCAFGALPFLFGGVCDNFFDAFFETVSGFTTTGSSILRSVEDQPRGILFWRSFTHWVGGMGVLALTIAVLPQVGSRNMEILRAESTGPSPGKLLPKLRDTVKALYLIYAALSAAMVIALLAAGQPMYDALVNMFGTAGTGGFSVMNSSIGGYNSPAVEMIIAVFMLLFGVNFAVYFAMVMRRFKKAVSNQELLLYFAIVAASVTLVAVNILPVYGSLGTALRLSFFQVTSVISTSGFASIDYNAWPTLSLVILILLTAIGACAGSTAGGIKVTRVWMLLKALRREIEQLLHPRIVRPTLVDGKPVEESTLRSVLVFFFMYFAVLIVSVMIVSIDGFDLTTTFTAALTAIGNVGPGLGLVGPAGNFADFSALSKTVLSVCMLIGRLEILPMLLLFAPSLWRRA